MTAVAWGIVGTGAIASVMARTLAALPDARLVGVGSRRLETAERFGSARGVERRYGSYTELLADPDIQAVYIATPHHLHYEPSVAALTAGKAVLCEKPLAVTAAQAAGMAAAARTSGSFLMEAMWMRFLPFMARMGELIAGGEIGEPLTVQADFGFRAAYDPAGRLFASDLAGGALLDLGVYPVHLAVTVLGTPISFRAAAVLGPTGVDHQVGAVLRHPGEGLSTLSASLVSDTASDAVVTGSRRRLRLPGRFHEARRIEVLDGDRVTAVHECDFPGHGFRFEVEEVHRCLRAGATESPIMPPSESVAIMELLDGLRAEAGIRYPMDRHPPPSSGQQPDR